MKAKKPRSVANPFSPRPYETDYSGIYPGHAKTLEGAIKAAHNRLILGEYARCTVTGPEGTVARLHWTPLGVLTWAPGTVKNRRKQLKRVK